MLVRFFIESTHISCLYRDIIGLLTSGPSCLLSHPKHTHTYIYIYIYIYVCVCVCVRVCNVWLGYLQQNRKERVINNEEIQYKCFRILSHYYSCQNSEFRFREPHQLTSECCCQLISFSEPKL